MNNKNFLHWLANRLVFKHGYSKKDRIVVQLNQLGLNNNSIDLKDDELDKILSKYYAGFFLEKTDDFNIGYSDKEREEIRSYVKALVTDVINRNIPKTILK